MGEVGGIAFLLRLLEQKALQCAVPAKGDLHLAVHACIIEFRS